MSDYSDLYQRARRAAGFTTSGDEIRAFMEAVDDSNLPPELRKKCQQEWERGRQAVKDAEAAELRAHTEAKARWTFERTPKTNRDTYQNLRVD